jgi:hypothetical protein
MEGTFEGRQPRVGCSRPVEAGIYGGADRSNLFYTRREQKWEINLALEFAAPAGD